MLRILIACIFAILLGGCASADPRCFPPVAGESFDQIVVFDNHWHTGIMLPFGNLPESLQSELNAFRDFRYIGVGWGDAEFLRTPNDQIGPGIVLRALFASRGSVLLMMGFSAEPEDLFSDNVDIYRIGVRPAGTQRIARAIETTFAQKDGKFLDAGAGTYEGSRFFDAIGRYSAFHTCNQWTADVLHAGGLPITPLYAGTAWNLAFQLQQLPNIIRNGSPIAPRPAPRPLQRFMFGSHGLQ